MIWTYHVYVHSHVLPYNIVKKGLQNKRSGHHLFEIGGKSTIKKATLQEARLLSVKSLQELCKDAERMLQDFYSGLKYLTKFSAEYGKSYRS